jgi:hypothetical protein
MTLRGRGREAGGLAMLAAACAALLSWGTPSWAAECGATGHGPVVWVTGTAKNYLAALARALYVDSNPITIIWRGQSSCDALDSTLSATPLSGTGSYWDPSQSSDEVSCTIPELDAGTVTADISITDIFASTCVALPNGLPNNVGDYFGPVQTMTFVVPEASSQKAISATAAYFVYGFGKDSGVEPWTDPTYIFRLDDASGTQRIISAGIGVPADKWKGTNAGYSAVMITDLTSVAAAAANSTIGILAATNITDTLVPQLNVLAYKHYGQACAYYPDSSESSRDKRNVRDGHYALWAPIHLFTRLDSKGVPTSSDALRVINYLTGATSPPGGVDLVQVAALNNLVPTCAMKVKREREMGALTTFSPQNPCNCYFEKVATGVTSCTACTGQADCTASQAVCSFGYCETP